MSAPQFKPELSLKDATMVVAGSMIGSGIFIVSADILRNVGSSGGLIAVWLITGLMTVMAGLSYGELSGMFPKAGGQYVYLKEAYNPLIAFLYGWSFFAVIQTGTIAAVGVAFSKFTAYLVPSVSENIVLIEIGFLKISPAQLLSIFVIVLLTFINSRGVKEGKFIQTNLTIIKLACLFGLVLAGLILGKKEIWDANWVNPWQIHSLAATQDYTLIAAMGAVAAAMTGSLFSSDAWNNVTFIAGEIKNPQRNIGLSLFLGTSAVILLYLLVNVMYLSVLPVHEIAFAEKDRVAVAVSTVIFGNAGTVLIAAMIMISTFGCNNGLILAGARVYYTMAKDGLFFKQVGTLNRFSVPQQALWAQTILASAWCLSGKYGDLLDMVSFVVVLFYLLTIAGIFILRKKQPDTPRPYKAFGYPFLPALYIVMGISFCLLLMVYKPPFTWPGLIITLAGIPLYFLVLKNKK
jgi:APA family basic amino acid/polyamine antiporter